MYRMLQISRTVTCPFRFNWPRNIGYYEARYTVVNKKKSFACISRFLKVIASDDVLACFSLLKSRDLCELTR